MISEEKHEMVMAEANKLSDKLYEVSETNADYLALMLTVSQCFLIGVVEIAAQESGNSIEETADFFGESLKKNVKLALGMGKEDDNSEE